MSTNTLTKIQSGNYPKMCYKINFVNSYDVSKEQLENGYLMGDEKDRLQTMKEIQNGTHSDKFLNVQLVKQFVGELNEPIALSFIVHPIGVKVNKDNTINLEYNLSSTEKHFESEVMCETMKTMINNVTTQIVDDISEELDIEFTPKDMNVKLLLLSSHCEILNK